jgi:hypothetical protein
MDGMSDQPLAGTSFAENENRGIRGGNLFHPEQNILKRIALADDLLKPDRLDLLAKIKVLLFQLEFQPLDLIQVLTQAGSALLRSIALTKSSPSKRSRGMYSSGQVRSLLAELMPMLYSEDLTAAIGIYKPARTSNFSSVCLSIAASGGSSSSRANEKISRCSANFLYVQEKGTGRASAGRDEVPLRQRYRQPDTKNYEKLQQRPAVDLEELQNLFQGIPDFIIDSLGGKGDESRREVGQQFFKPRRFSGSPSAECTWFYSFKPPLPA